MSAPHREVVRETILRALGLWGVVFAGCGPSSPASGTGTDTTATTGASIESTNGASDQIGASSASSEDATGPTPTTNDSTGSGTTTAGDTGTGTSGATGGPDEPESCILTSPAQQDAFGASTTEPSTTGTSTGDTSPPVCDPDQGVEERTECFNPIGDLRDGLCNEFADATPQFDLLSCSGSFLYDEMVLDFCGPYVDGGELCCFDLRVAYVECCGRPFVVDSELRFAATVPRTDWIAPLQPRLQGLDATTLRLLARAWSDDAAAEHASIASFARFILQLLAVSAPAALVAEAQAALADEVEHARLCYALASAYAGSPLGPDRLATEGAFAEVTDLSSAALATLYEGCIGETLAAIEATAASRLALDPVVARVLTRIADDERRHAALAWRFLAWTLEHGDHQLHDALASAVAGVEIAAPQEHEPAVALEGHGRLSPATKYAERRAGLREVIRPIAHALLRQRAPAAA